MAKRHQLIARLSGLFTILISSTILLGWILEDKKLASFFYKDLIVNPLAAFLLLLTGLQVLFCKPKRSTLQNICFLALSFILLGVSFLKFSSEIFHFASAFEDIFSVQKFGTKGILTTLSPSTTACLVLIGLSLLPYANGKKRILLSYIILFLVGFIALTTLIGYIFNTPVIYKYHIDFVPMAMPVAICLLLTVIGLTYLRPSEGIMRLLVDQSSTGHLMKIVLPLSLILPVAFGWIRLQGYYHGFFTNETGVALMVIVNIIAISLVIWVGAIRIFLTEETNKEINTLLSENEARLSTILNSIGEAVFVTDLKCNVIYMNPIARDLIGASEERGARNINNLLKFRSQRNVSDFIERCIENNRPLSSEKMEFIRLGSKEVPSLISASPLVENKRNIKGAVLVLRDVTFEHTAIQRERLQSSIVEHSLDAIITLDKEFNIIGWNKASEKFFGFSDNEVLGKKIYEIIPPIYTDTTPEEVQQKLLIDGHWFGEVRQQAKGGNWVYNLSSVVVHKDEFGNITGYHSIMKDISERKQLEKTVAEFNQKLEQKVKQRTDQLSFMNHKLWQEISGHRETLKKLNQSNKSLEIFLYRASHDLKGPVASLEGILKVSATEKAIDEKGRQYLGMIDTVVRKMRKIIDGLLATIRVGIHELQLKHIDFHSLVEGIRAFLIADPEAKNVEFEVNIEIRDFYCDETLVSTILQNLIENAIKYRNHSFDVNSKVAVTIRKENEQLLMIVSDNGIGIPSNYQEKVFEMYYRANTFTSGSGLGLFIVKQAVDRLNGKLELRSEVGVGTEIRITLPFMYDKTD